MASNRFLTSRTRAGRRSTRSSRPSAASAGGSHHHLPDHRRRHGQTGKTAGGGRGGFQRTKRWAASVTVLEQSTAPTLHAVHYTTPKTLGLTPHLEALNP